MYIYKGSCNFARGNWFYCFERFLIIFSKSYEQQVGRHSATQRRLLKFPLDRCAYSHWEFITSEQAVRIIHKWYFRIVTKIEISRIILNVPKNVIQTSMNSTHKLYVGEVCNTPKFRIDYWFKGIVEYIS